MELGEHICGAMGDKTGVPQTCGKNVNWCQQPGLLKDELNRQPASQPPSRRVIVNKAAVGIFSPQEGRNTCWVSKYEVYSRNIREPEPYRATNSPEYSLN